MSLFMLSMFVLSIFGQNQEMAYILYNDQKPKLAPGPGITSSSQGHTKGEDHTVNSTTVYFSIATQSQSLLSSVASSIFILHY